MERCPSRLFGHLDMNGGWMSGSHNTYVDQLNPSPFSPKEYQDFRGRGALLTWFVFEGPCWIVVQKGYLIPEGPALGLLFFVSCAPKPARRTISDKVELSYVVPLALPSGCLEEHLLRRSLCGLADSLSTLSG